MMLASRLQPPLPPPWAPSFRSDDLDEVRAFVGAVDIQHARSAARHDALGYHFFSVTGTDVAVGCSTVAVAQTVRGRVATPVLHLTQPTGSVYRVGRRVSASTDGLSAVIVAPEWEFTRVSPPGTVLSIRFDHSALCAELESRRPAAGGSGLLKLDVLALTGDEKAAFMAATAELMQSTRPGSDRRRLAHAEGRVVASMADLVLRGAEAAAAGSLSPARMADLEVWIEEHLDAPITLGRLCHVAGVGARCLQKTFDSRRGMSPMRFVAERRIVAAFKRIRHAGPKASVTRIALDLGFDHLGRFGQMYKQVIGESPSQTLAARLPAAARRQTSCESGPALGEPRRTPSIPVDPRRSSRSPR